MSIWQRVAAKLSITRPAPTGPAGRRAYGIGDIHGRLDLLDDLISQIEADIETSPDRENFIVFLGDLIDRGPQSAEVVERLRTYRCPNATTVFLAGNHEEILLRVMAAEVGLLESWLRFGGIECAESYGVDIAALRRSTERTGAALLAKHIPRSHLAFIRSFADTFRFGDYLFVHAGIRPGIPLESQNSHDLRWIRDPFLSDRSEHEFVVVHGHTVVDQVEERGNRIAIDTGAVRSGVLTAIVLEDGRRRFLSTASPARSFAAAA